MPKLSVDLEHSGVFGRFFGRHTEEFYLLFRLIFAVLLGLHGAQKTFLLWGFPKEHELGLWVDVAAWLELACAFMIAFGVLTRLAGGTMVVLLTIAYFMIYLPQGIWPHEYTEEGFNHFHNGHEVVISFFAFAGIIGILGSGKWGLERFIRNKELL